MTYGAPDDGHLGLWMTNTKYVVRTDVHYVVTLDPGIYNFTNEATISHVTRSQCETEHNEARWDFRTKQFVESIIKNNLNQAIPPSLIIEIEDEITGLNNIKIIDILDHVRQQRGRINYNLIDKNNLRFRENFDATLRMAAYIRKIKEYQQLPEDRGKGWSDFQLVWVGQTTMGQSGLYADAYLIWQRRTQAQNTCVALKTYWMDTFKEHEDINKLNGIRNTWTKKLDAEMENIVAIISSDKNQVEMILATNTLLEKKLSKKNVTITQLKKKVSNLVNTIRKNCCKTQ